jgi:hypothetical protein
LCKRLISSIILRYYVRVNEWGTPVGLYPVTVVLFLFPCLLLFAGWKQAAKGWHEPRQLNYRSKCTNASLVVASLATLVGMACMLAWLRSGGNPHGMGAQPGIWQPLGRVFKWSLALAIILAVVGKGKARSLVLGAAVADVLAGMMVILLDMD